MSSIRGIIRRMWNWALTKFCLHKDFMRQVHALIIFQLLVTVSVVYSALAVLNLRIITSFVNYYLIALISALIGLPGLGLLINALLRYCMAIPKLLAIAALIYSSILTGISTAYFIALTVTFSFFINSLPSLIFALLSLPFFIVSVSMVLQMIFVVLFPEREVYAIGGNLTITAIGVLAMSMGIALSVISSTMHSSSITANLSAIAGPVTGSGLSLIAVGLQRYYDEREKRVHG